MTCITAGELMGKAPRAQPRRKRVVCLLGLALAGHLAKKARTKAKNARYWRKLKADPERKKDRSTYMRAYRQANAAKMQAYRDAWKERNPERHRVYHRTWQRGKVRRLAQERAK